MASKARRAIGIGLLFTAVAGLLALTAVAGAGGGASTAGAEVIVGDGSDNVLTGTRGRDKIRGKGGDDRIRGRKGRDKLVGGRGSDSVRGGSGSDRVKVADGRVDVVECGAGRGDRVKGDADLDVVSGCERGATQLADFASAVKLSIEGDYLRVRSNGIPDHATGEFPNASNPNSITEQDLDYLLPLEPEPADEPTETGGGPIGITLSGAPFYNPYNAGGLDAVVVETFDQCEGHPDPSGTYHYHQYSPCIADDGVGHSEIWAYAFDGYAVYGPDGVGGSEPTDLDRCNGHSDPRRGYHYHASEELPYLIGCFSGEVEAGSVPPAGPPTGPPMSAGIAAGMVGLPLALLGGALFVARRRPAP